MCLVLCDPSGWPYLCQGGCASAEQRGDFTPSAALSNPAGARGASALCRQILEGISLRLLEAVCSEVVTGNLLMVKNQDTSFCLPRKTCPPSQTLELKQPTE